MEHEAGREETGNTGDVDDMIFADETCEPSGK